MRVKSQGSQICHGRCQQVLGPKDKWHSIECCGGVKYVCEFDFARLSGNKYSGAHPQKMFDQRDKDCYFQSRQAEDCPRETAVFAILITWLQGQWIRCRGCARNITFTVGASDHARAHLEHDHPVKDDSGQVVVPGFLCGPRCNSCNFALVACRGILEKCDGDVDVAKRVLANLVLGRELGDADTPKPATLVNWAAEASDFISDRNKDVPGFSAADHREYILGMSNVDHQLYVKRCNGLIPKHDRHLHHNHLTLEPINLVPSPLNQCVGHVDKPAQYQAFLRWDGHSPERLLELYAEEIVLYINKLYLILEPDAPMVDLFEQVERNADCARLLDGLGGTPVIQELADVIQADKELDAFWFAYSVFLDSHPMTDVDYHEIVVMKNPNYTPPTDATGRQYGRGRTPHGFRPPVYCRCPTCVQALEDRNHFQVHYHHELDGGWSRDEILDAGPVNQATTLCPAANAVIGPAQEAALAVLLGLRPNVTIEEVRRTLQATSGNVAAARSALQG